VPWGDLIDAHRALPWSLTSPIIIAIVALVPLPIPSSSSSSMLRQRQRRRTTLAFVAPLKLRNEIPLTIRREPIILTGSKDTNLLLGELDAADYA
jgi:hypothetical protein